MSVLEYKRQLRVQKLKAAGMSPLDQKNRGWGRPVTAPPKNLQHLNQTPKRMKDAMGRSYEFARSTVHWNK